MHVSPVRVLQVFGKMDRGGAESLVMNIYRVIDRNAIQFDFLVHSLTPGHFDEEIEQLGGRVFRIPAPGISTVWRYWSNVAKTLKSQGPFAAIHSHVQFFSGVVMVIAASCHVPRRICHSHTTRLPHAKAMTGSFYRTICRAAIWQFSTNHVGCSRETCEILYGKCCWNDPRVEVIRNAIETSAFIKHSSTKCSPSGLPDGDEDVLVVHVGNFTPPKNHSFILRVFQALLYCLPNARLLLIGDGLLRKDVEELAIELGVSSRVSFLGSRSDVPDILGRCHVMLFPSLWEGIPVSLVEAQACGVPCVVSDVINREVDLDIGLLTRHKLNEPIDDWVKALANSLGQEKLPWQVRESAIAKAGYDIHTVIARLGVLYGEERS